LLPEYEIIDIGYLENRKYSVILIGKIQIQDNKAEIDTDGFLYAKWGMTVDQVREKFNFFFTNPNVELRTTQIASEIILTASGAETKNIFGCLVGNAFIFKFRNNELYLVNYQEEHPLAPWHPNYTGKEKSTVTCGALLVNRYQKEVDSLYKKYGQPVKNQEYNKIWVLPSTTIEVDFMRLKSHTPDALYAFSLEYEKR
jgi:hypothetical protein